MKFSSNALLLLFASLQGSSFVAGHDHENPVGECTHGKLFVSDLNSNDLHVYDLDAESMADLSIESTIQAPGGNGQIVEITGAGNIVSKYQGSEDQSYADGRINFLTSGLSVDDHGDHVHVNKATPSIISNAGFDCTHPVHVVNHDFKVGIFCDGYYSPQINTTVWVVDETKMSGSDSPIVFTETLQGSHHGVCVPVDDDHVMHSVATQDRINHVSDNSLPDTFVVVDYDNNVVRSLLTDTSDLSTHCKGFHGSTAIENTFALACDSTHGAIVVVEYDNTTSTYESRALSYPREGHRTGSFAESHLNSHIVGNFAGDDNRFHLISFDPEEVDKLGENHILTLDSRQCSFGFERKYGEHLLVWLPSGKLEIYKVNPWSLVREIQVVEGMGGCGDADMVIGYDQVFFFTFGPTEILALDLSDVEDGGSSITIAKTSLGYTPNSAVVAGLSICEVGHDESGASSIALVTAGLVSAAGWFLLM
eukprot:scaffold5926_cov102-Cylindrotheca_fusiformis.AAC.2